MRKALLGAIAVAALAFAAPASAGCWATAGLAPPPAGTAAGDVWTAKLTILQHGRNPLPDAADAKPTVTIVNQASGERQTFTARSTDAAAGRYEAQVVFPSAGTWRYEVFDGFTSWNGQPAPCAKTHTFAAAQIGGPGAGSRSGGGPPKSVAGPSKAVAVDTRAFPVWPVAGGVGALLAAAIVLLYFVRKHSSRSPAAA